MGIAASFLAFKNTAPEQVHELLGLESTGREARIHESDAISASLPSGWYLVILKRKEFTKHRLAELSKESKILYGYVEEHVMFSTAAAWTDGRKAWSVEHSAENGLDHLDFEGELPNSFEKIREKQLELHRQAEDEGEDVDHMFDVPVELHRTLLGFTLEVGLEGDPDHRFAVLHRRKRKSLLAKLFG